MQERDEKGPKIEVPATGPGSELRGEPVTEAPAEGENPEKEEKIDEEDADVQEQPPRPPTKEDEGVRGRPGQQSGT